MQIVDLIVTRKKNWIGYNLKHECLLKEIMEGKMGVKRLRGRPKIGMLNQLIEYSYVDMRNRAENRKDRSCWIY